MSYQVTLNALGTSYNIPSAGQTNYVNDLSLYLRDLATVVNDASSGSLVTPVFNVKTYGATGNGSTNDTTAILLAMVALQATGTVGGTLYFPAGTYVISSGLTFGITVAQANVKITGDGSSSILKPTGAFSTSAVITFRNCNYWGISDIVIDSSARTGSGANVLVDGCSYGLLTNATVKNSPGYGVDVTQVSGSGPSTYNVVDRNVYSSNASGNTHLTVTATAVGNFTYNATGVVAAPYIVNCQAKFGIAANDTTDDTAAIQAALDFGYNEVVAGRPCELQFPPGVMKVTSTLLWRGGSSQTPALTGATAYGISFDPPKSTFRWHGTANQDLFFAQGANCGLLRDLQFDANSLAGCAADFSATTFADRSVLAATNGVRVLNCVFRCVKIQTVGNAAVKLGTPATLTGGNTTQFADCRFDNCRFVGEDSGAPGFTFAGMKAAGVLQTEGGNCKLFSFNYCDWDLCNIALDCTQSSGPVNVLIAEMGDVRQAFGFGAGSLNVIGGDIECDSVDDFRLLVGTTQIGSTVLIRGVECAAFMSGAVGTMVEYAGSLTMDGNPLLRNNNSSVSGDPALPNPFKLIVSTGTPGTYGSFNSRQNWYFGCGFDRPFAPIYDGSGNDLAPVSGVYGGANALKVSSYGDYGGTDVSKLSLGVFDSSGSVLFSLQMNGTAQLSYLIDGTVSNSTIGITTILSVDAHSGDLAYTLPAAATTNTGRIIRVTKRDSTSHTVTVNGIVLSNQGETIEFVSGRGIGPGFTPGWEVFLQPASSTNSGTLTVGPQSIAGAKTFLAAVAADSTDSTGVPGNATINKPSGRSSVASGAQTCVVTNSMVTSAASKILITPHAVDTAAPFYKAVAGSGSFTVSTYNTSGSLTNVAANWAFDWFVVN